MYFTKAKNIVPYTGVFVNIWGLMYQGSVSTFFFLHSSLWTLNYDVSNSVVRLFKYNLFLAYLLFGPTCLTKIFYAKMDVNFLINITTLLTKIIVETQLSNAVWNRKQKNYGPFP